MITSCLVPFGWQLCDQSNDVKVIHVEYSSSPASDGEMAALFPDIYIDYLFVLLSNEDVAG